MDNAKCLLDEKIYTASEFSRLPPNELSNKRQHLVCVECQATAFFRKSSRNGRGACFGALPHHKGCSLSLSDAQVIDNSVDNEKSNELVKLYLTNILRPTGDSDQDLNIEEREKIGLSYSDKYLRNAPEIRKHLRASLKYMIFNEDFKKYNKEDGIEDELIISSNKSLVNFNNINISNINEIKGYWGMLTDARFSNEGSLWLNSGGAGDVSCVIPAEMVDNFFERYGLEDEEDLAGAYILLISELQVSSSGKKYIKLDNINNIDLVNLKIDKNTAENFFINEKAKIAFFLMHNARSVFDDELGIKKKHYMDKSAAKEWRAKFSSQFHPDKNHNDSSMDYDEILSCINKIYNRMVGKA